MEVDIKRYKLISCGVLRKEIDSIRDNIPVDVELTEVWLEQGLHREPDRLNKLVKEEIAATESDKENLDAILLGYGLCSYGTVGVKSDIYTIVVPRAHDCITLFLGSKDRYLDEFSKVPGTYWYTPGFISGKFQPGMSEKYAGVYHEFEENYEKYLEKFGDAELAKYIIDSQEQAWIKNYSRGAFVNSGLPGGDELKKKAQKFCRERDWTFEEVKGDFSLLVDLVSGNWDHERFLVIEPGEKLVAGGVTDIITTDSAVREGFDFGGDYENFFVYDGEFREVSSDDSVTIDISTDIVIGIDAGGTYTDATVVSLNEKKVLAASKSSTTYHDLSIGIRNALLKLPDKLLRKAQRLAISTTLATNAIVEEKGSRTGLILIGYDEYTFPKVTIGSGDIKAIVEGCHSIYGNEKESLNEQSLIKTAESMIKKGVEALAISSYMGIRNPEHEIRAAEILSSRFAVPVVTGHELTDDLDSIRRANTVLLNARLMPIISRLVDSINHVVNDLKLSTDIRIVTTDGSLMNTNEARQMPVRMVLSGPAASVMGVRFLTDIESCVLIDMGGTTTDIAVIEGGSAKRTGRGAFVGRYKTSIKATDIRTVGLGGDSGIMWVNNRLIVGPKRVEPISRLASEYPDVKDRLPELKDFKGSDYELVQPAVFFVLISQPENTSFLTAREQLALRFLKNGPLSEVDLAESLNYPYFSLLGLERLEELGIIRRSGLTPTDLMVASGLIDKWDREAAELLINIYAGRSGLSPEEFVHRAWDEVHWLSASAVITETLSDGKENGSFPGCRFCEQANRENGQIKVKYNLRPRLVGIGAPTREMIEGISKYIDAEKIFPRWAEVANAIGAASGAGGMHIDMLIMSEGSGRFDLYSPEGMFTFRSLDDAKSEAIKLSRECAQKYAERMNYDKFSLNIKVHDRSAPTTFNNDVYIDTSVVARMRY
ncbi:MAG TPA: DUF1638 domain-containing protein [bacterium]|nr:DUF1638 domain-containing protein [bacterium]